LKQMIGEGRSFEYDRLTFELTCGRQTA
jgi:hypothetical protein